ncbi:MAG TPA: hypothetical protein VLA96_02145 [Terriglobales bacterium]|nr:hypothetical protein [Terriglobales bacterium]
MGPKKHILTISRDQVLQHSRTLLLQHTGYTVTALLGDSAVSKFLDAAARPALDLVLMCHSVPEPSRVRLCDDLKLAYPDTPVLMLYNGYDPTAAKVDGRIMNTHDPKALVDALTMLVRP